MRKLHWLGEYKMSQLQQPLSLPFSRIIFISVLSLLFSLFVTCNIVNLQLINRREPTPPTHYSTPHTTLPQVTGLRSYRLQATGYRTFRLQSLKLNYSALRQTHCNSHHNSCLIRRLSLVNFSSSSVLCHPHPRPKV